MTDFDESTPRSAPKPGSIAARAMAARGSQSPDYLAGLNPEQRAAVETTEGPVLVLAGAGTGKTRVLTTRIAHIVSTGRAWPSQILAVTFTNKAAREMKTRIGLLLGGQVEGMPWLGTFHSIGVKILRRHAELVGLKSNFTILDTDDQIRLIKQLIQAENLDDKRWPARTFANMLDAWKNKGLEPANIPEGDARAFGNGKGRELYKAYQDRLKSLNACDFGDLLMHPIAIFRAHPDVLADYHRRFRYILVDEYQDTNVAQYLWLRLLAQRSALQTATGGEGETDPFDDTGPRAIDDDPDAHDGMWDDEASPAEAAEGSPPAGSDDAGRAVDRKGQPPRINICCVGDDDQSIYGWRGAEVDNILRFDKDFPGATVIRLERNYRSTGHILGAASHLIGHNEDRLGKTLFTDHPDPDDPKVEVNAGWDSEEEARAIGEAIEDLQRREDHDLNDMAILVRASFQMRTFEDRFVTMGLNYRVIGGPRFYERMEIRDAMAYFRCVCQPADDLAFERIVNTPKRGLGDATIRLLHDYARARGVPLIAAAMQMVETEELKPKPRNTLRRVVTDFLRWSELLPNTKHTELAEQILEESGYTEMWQNDRSAEAPGRLENLKELIRSMEEYESLPSFLEHVALVMDTEQNAEMDAVSIMTLHSAKGLEFETVFLPGWEEGLFPHQRSLDEGGRSGLEEERRLAYVGITRGKRRVKIWFVSNRRIHGLWQSTIPSRFLDELPEAHVDVMEANTSYGGYGAGGFGAYGSSRWDGAAAFNEGAYKTPGWRRAQAAKAGFAEGGAGQPGGRGGDGWSGGRSREIDYDAGASGARAGRGHNQPARQGLGLHASARRGGPREIEGELVAKSVSTDQSRFDAGDRVFHLKFGPGTVALVDGNKLTVDFDKAGQKRVLEGFVESA
ncbi:UvrD-helicase domain-containing protein [Fulvimarina sp. 2208YS6-2-32]|uniref:DNA 3'-5' helicase n=1 Tax=Fulvimarina uroteuthidis TaxID=3098149 RepID=A0ABU5I4A1_9HYPH|nr:UvrD-helicase domain-containing protein [Fulvimarina sp. 2208YS6-2-32]MDY8109758.1 UvrD-helicase domain-containing protein [Fulvimarina sp. 2208YS6-2-32]